MKESQERIKQKITDSGLVRHCLDLTLGTQTLDGGNYFRRDNLVIEHSLKNILTVRYNGETVLSAIKDSDETLAGDISVEGYLVRDYKEGAWENFIQQYIMEEFVGGQGRISGNSHERDSRSNERPLTDYDLVKWDARRY